MSESWIAVVTEPARALLAAVAGPLARVWQRAADQPTAAERPPAEPPRLPRV